MPLTMPEELILLMLDDGTGRLHEGAGPGSDHALAAAVLAELELQGRIRVSADRLEVADPSPTGDPLLDPALARLAAGGEARGARGWIEVLAGDAEASRSAVLERLVARGILRAEEGRFLWIFPERRYPVIDDREEREVKARLLDAILSDGTPPQRDALLIGLASAAGLFPLILAPEELERAEPRIEAISRHEALNRSLTDAVRELFLQMARYAPMM